MEGAREGTRKGQIEELLEGWREKDGRREVWCRDGGKEKAM